jgi:hypothetical protein
VLSPLVVALAIGNLIEIWVETGLRESRSQSTAADLMRRRGGKVNYDWHVHSSSLRIGPRPLGSWDSLYATPWWDSRRWLALATGRRRDFSTVGAVDFRTRRTMSDAEWEYFCRAFWLAQYAVIRPDGDEQLRFVARIGNLKELVLIADEGASITGEGFTHLTKLRHLKTVCLHSVRLTPAGRRALGGLEFLERVQLTGEAEDDTLGQLTKLTRLESLVLIRTRITDAGLAHVRQMPALRFLGVYSTHVSDDGVRQLAGLKITALALNGTDVTDRGIAYLVRMPEVSWLNLSNTALTDAAVADLEKLKHLETLYLRNTRLSNSGCEKLWAALPKLTYLYMPGGKILRKGNANDNRKGIDPKTLRAQTEASKRQEWYRLSL